MTSNASISARIAALLTVVAVSGCAGTHVSKYSYDASAYKVNAPVYGEGCYDASVLLEVDAARTKRIAGMVLLALDSTPTASSDTSIQAQRNRHVGVFVGSGGEELAIRWKPVDASSTFVTATTKTGFVGGAGQKAWSCEVVDQMLRMAAR